VTFIVGYIYHLEQLGV